MCTAARLMLQNWTVVFSSDEVEIAYKQAKRKVIIAAHTFPFLDGLGSGRECKNTENPKNNNNFNLKKTYLL